MTIFLIFRGMFTNHLKIHLVEGQRLRVPIANLQRSNTHWHGPGRTTMVSLQVLVSRLALKALNEDTLDFPTNLAFLRYNYRHFHKQGLPTCSQTRWYHPWAEVSFAWYTSLTWQDLRWKLIQLYFWFVVSKMNFIFHFISETHWRTSSFFRGVAQPPTSTNHCKTSMIIP
jgi:hypothetical protein